MGFQTAAKLSGARFVVLKSGLARMERALVSSCSTFTPASMDMQKWRHRCWCETRYCTDCAAAKVRDDQFFALPGQCMNELRSAPSAEAGNERASVFDRRLGLIPTASPLTNLVRDSILDEEALPMRFAACTLAFAPKRVRRERTPAG